MENCHEEIQAMIDEARNRGLMYPKFLQYGEKFHMRIRAIHATHYPTALVYNFAIADHKNEHEFLGFMLQDRDTVILENNANTPEHEDGTFKLLENKPILWSHCNVYSHPTKGIVPFIKHFVTELSKGIVHDPEKPDEFVFENPYEFPEDDLFAPPGQIPLLVHVIIRFRRLKLVEQMVDMLKAENIPFVVLEGPIGPGRKPLYNPEDAWQSAEEFNRRKGLPSLKEL